MGFKIFYTKEYYTNYKIGIIKRRIFKLLRKIFGFGIWHLEPINFRPYALNIIYTLSKSKSSNLPIVECGCGLGEIIAAIDKKNVKYGYDLSNSVIKAAKVLHPSIKFRVGSFQDIKIGKIDCFIMVNFIHGIKPEELKSNIDILLIKNDIRMFIFDTIKNSTKFSYAYEHEGEYLLGEEYYLYKRSKGFEATGGARRYIEYWVKKRYD